VASALIKKDILRRFSFQAIIPLSVDFVPAVSEHRLHHAFVFVDVSANRGACREAADGTPVAAAVAVTALALQDTFIIPVADKCI